MAGSISWTRVSASLRPTGRPPPCEDASLEPFFGRAKRDFGPANPASIGDTEGKPRGVTDRTCVEWRDDFRQPDWDQLNPPARSAAQLVDVWPPGWVLRH
jgi:hypothetical protein